MMMWGDEEGRRETDLVDGSLCLFELTSNLRWSLVVGRHVSSERSERWDEDKVNAKMR